MQPWQHPYSGTQAVLSTMHGKEQAIGSVLRDRLGIEVVVPDGVDTDLLGTFSGVVPRSGTRKDVAIRKARMGMDLTGLPISFASEGTFGPHPAIPFVRAGNELMVAVDDIHGIAVTESLVTTDIVFSSRKARSIADVSDWLASIAFPGHGLFVMPNEPAPGFDKASAVTDVEGLGEWIEAACARSCDGQALVFTDMRAHRNPTRMKAIGALAIKLSIRLSCLCPDCSCPGYGRTGQEQGLPCAECGYPTGSIIRERFGCASCGHHVWRSRGDGRTHEEAMHCPACNP